MSSELPQPSTSKDVEDLESSLSSSEEAEQIHKRRKRIKSYTQKYTITWEQEPEFKGWLKSSKKGSNYAFCKACNRDFICGKSEIQKHSSGKQHTKLVKSLHTQKTLTDMSSYMEKTSLNKKVKTAEIRMAAYAAEHNIPFNTLDHLSEIIRISFDDSEIAKNFTCSRTKATAIVNNVLGQYSFENSIELLRSKKFSLIVDESTDKGTIKHLALVARIFHDHKITDLFFGLLAVPNATAEELYNTIVNYFSKYNINYKDNLIGFASDGANAMMGIHNSLSTKLKADIPNLFIMKCVCHSFSLCANYACEKLPNDIEQMTRDVHTYLQYSFKRQTEFAEFQEFVAVKPHKILQPSQTRWLSVVSVVKRIIEQYDALKLYFTNQCFNNKGIQAQNILDFLQNPSTILYLNFLNFVLPLFMDLNLEMQSESIKIHILYKRVENVLRTLLDCYLKKDYLDKTLIENIEYKNPHYFVEIESVYLGVYVTGAISNNEHRLKEAELLDFRRRCLDFLIEGCSQIYKRFDNRNKTVATLKHMSLISPDEVISKKHTSLGPLLFHFPNLTVDKINDIDREWRILRNLDLNEYKNLSVQEFWVKIGRLKTGDDSLMFPTLSNFVFCLFSLPHSSANVERIFSKINLNKTKIRNKLSTESLSGILHSHVLFKNDSCYKFSIPNDMLKKMDSSMYLK